MWWMSRSLSENVFCTLRHVIQKPEHRQAVCTWQKRWMDAVVMTHTYAHKHTTVASQQLTDSSIQEVVKFRHFPSSSVLYTVTRLHPKKLINIGEMNVLGVLTFFFFNYWDNFFKCQGLPYKHNSCFCAKYFHGCIDAEKIMSYSLTPAVPDIFMTQICTYIQSPSFWQHTLPLHSVPSYLLSIQTESRRRSAKELSVKMSASIVCYEQVKLKEKCDGNVLWKQTKFTADKMLADIMKQ